MRVTELPSLGHVHRQAVLGSLPPGAHMLACGARSTVEDLADDLPPGATLTMVDSGAACLHDHVDSARDERFDVIFIDGHASATCLAQARDLLRDDGRIFLHDAQRPSFDEAKLLFVEHGTIGPCRETSRSHLWHGGLQRRRAVTTGDLPVIVSYFTAGTPYEELGARLRASCEALQLRHHIVPLEPTGSWEANCAAKARVCLEAWKSLGTSILWVDADAIVRQAPSLVAAASTDFAVHKWKGWRFASGTVFFAQTPLGGELLECWARRCVSEPRVWDQVHLDLAWEEVTSSAPLHTMWLPRGYCQIFDAGVEDGDEIVIEHFQASRDLKALVTDGAPMPRPDGSEEFCRARPASRPVECRTETDLKAMAKECRGPCRSS